MKNTFIEETLKEFRDKFSPTLYKPADYIMAKVEVLMIDFITQKLEEAINMKEDHIHKYQPINDHQLYCECGNIKYIDQKCLCHCHAGGNYKDCKSHPIIECHHCESLQKEKEEVNG